MLLIGSQALHIGHRKLCLLDRKPADVDIIGTDEELTSVVENTPNVHAVYPISKGKKTIIRAKNLIIEFEVAWPGSTAEILLQLVEAETIWMATFGDIDIPSLDVLYTLKMSHRYLRNTPHFEKTRSDILKMRGAGANIPDYLKDWERRRERETYWYQHPSLNRTKEEFFSDDGLTYIYDHDSIHEQVAQASDGIPAYRHYMKDGSEVLTDRRKWDAVAHPTKMNGVVEEATVLALERSQIPHAGVWTPEKSFIFALQKVCTSITSGYFRKFAWENYDVAKVIYDHDYTKKFWKAVKAGKVKLHKQP